jgi:cytochrome b subunit of formate dehydrogenase
VAGLLFAALTVAHLATAVVMVGTRRWKATMMITRQDVRDTLQNLRYYLGRADTPPRFARYDYRQKYEYWGLIFGSMVMVASGLLLFFPVLVTRLLPAQLIPAAKVMHSNEAMLAMLIILVWHLYGAHLNPEVFPMDSSMFTGKISKQRLLHEHPLEYEEIYGSSPAHENGHESGHGTDARAAAEPGASPPRTG